jgi:N-acetylmuramoyl-L-alanine amidase
MSPIKYLTIHCAATPEGRDVKAETIATWHKGRAPYHFVIEMDGTFKRTLNDSQLGAHTARANTGNIGICYIGGCDKAMKPKDTRTEAQKKSLLTLIRTYKARYPGIIIRGHRDWPKVAKACPSFDVAAWLREVGEA